MNCGVLRSLVRAYNRFQRLQIGVKPPAIGVRYFLKFATLIIHLIHIVPALFVHQRHLRIVRRRVQVVDHVRHCGHCRVIGRHRAIHTRCIEYCVYII